MSSIFKNFFQKGQDENTPGEVEYIGEAPASTENVKVTIKVLGQVQGVGFRFTTKEAADQIGVTGVVRNENDGSVYVEAAGDKEQIDHFVDSLAKGPSPAASVDRVIVEYDSSIKNRDSFSQTY